MASLGIRLKISSSARTSRKAHVGIDHGVAENCSGMYYRPLVSATGQSERRFLTLTCHYLLQNRDALRRLSTANGRWCDTCQRSLQFIACWRGIACQRSLQFIACWRGKDARTPVLRLVRTTLPCTVRCGSRSKRTLRGLLPVDEKGCDKEQQKHACSCGRPDAALYHNRSPL